MHPGNKIGRAGDAYDWAHAKAAAARGDVQSADADLLRVFEARAAELARPRGGQSRVGTPHLRFSVGPASFAVALSEIETVVRPPWITRVPCANPPVDRVFQHAGRIVAVLDLARLVGIDAGATKGSGAVIVLADAANGLGIEPTSIAGLADLDDGELDRSATVDLGIARGVTADLTIVLTSSGLAERARARVAPHPKELPERQS